MDQHSGEGMQTVKKCIIYYGGVTVVWKCKLYGGDSISSLWVREGKSGLFDEVPSEQSPEDVREPAIHLSPGRVAWERDLLVIDH